MRRLVLVLACFGLLGQGERCEVDPRFSSPGATLRTYWQALATDDPGTVMECFADPAEAVPFPGMLWFLPPSRELGVACVELEPLENGRVIATYEVHFLPWGGSDELSVVTGSELVRVGSEWRIASAGGEVGVPEWRPIPLPVDI